MADQCEGMAGLPRLDSYEMTARRDGWPEHLVPWIVNAAAMLHRLVAKQDEVDWQSECGKPLKLVGPEDVCDGYTR